MDFAASVPNELLSKILGCLDAKSDLGNARLACKRFDQIAVEILFSSVTLYAHYFLDEGDYVPWPSDYDSQIFRNILDHQELKKHVRRVTIYTCETHCDHHPLLRREEGCQGFLPCAQYDDAWSQCINRIHEFPNLRSVILCFDRHAVHEDESDGEGDIFQYPYDRVDVVERVIGAWNENKEQGWKELAIRHYQANTSCLELSPLWNELLGKLDTLRLSIVHGQFRPEGGQNIRHGNPHPFWAAFPSKFLQPATLNLKNLILYSSMPLGWFPKLDLRSTQFRNLRSLSLGHFIFSHDWQFDWIVSHHALRSLYLDRCSILYQIGFAIHGWLDEEGYPREDPPDPDRAGEPFGTSAEPGLEREDNYVGSRLKFVLYECRWHEIFARFARELTQLRNFKFGSSNQWNFDTRSRYTDGDGEPFPIMPWEAEEGLKNEIFDGRYVHWDDWLEEYNTIWDKSQTDENGDMVWKEEWRARMNPPPDCREEDEAALRSLLSKVRG